MSLFFSIQLSKLVFLLLARPFASPPIAAQTPQGLRPSSFIFLSIIPTLFQLLLLGSRPNSS
jgi:hypothetical protein